MAHNVDTSFLLDRLIKSLIKKPLELDIERCKRSALRTLANSHFTRISQFEITARLDGLEEKWMIHNKDSLAEALHVRRAELSVTSNKWTPEILSLLLQLSDRPFEHPNFVDLAVLKPKLPSVDNVAEDSLDDGDGIWEDVDYAADDSDNDERTGSIHSGRSILTLESSVAGQLFDAYDETLIEPAPSVCLRSIQNAQLWDSQALDKSGLICEEDEDRRPREYLTELQAGREVIFTFLGLPTSIFSQENEGQISVSRSDFLMHASQESLTGLLQGFAAIASKLFSIRHWVEKDIRVPLEQTFQAALASRLETLDRALSAIQIKLLACDAQAVTSLLELYDETSKVTRLLLQVHDILKELDISSEDERPFRVLECLFNRTCIKQSIGDAEGYQFFAQLFLECFQTYLKPIRLWMEKGQLTGFDGVIFIKKEENDVNLNSVWQDQYHLINDSNGDLHAPKFLDVAAKKIFDTGKSVDFLRRLGCESHDSREDPLEDFAVTYESVCLSSDIDPFSPFAELFDMALNRWVAKKQQASLSELRTQLESRCSLQSSLDALEYIYFANGAVNTDVNNKIFERIGCEKHRWNDDTVVTEWFKTAFSSIPSDRLQIYLAPANQRETKISRRSMSALENVRVSYTLPWPVANVIRPDSVQVYQRIFIFLTQLQRAKYLLQRQKPAKSVQAADRKLFLRIYRLRHRLLWLTNTLLTYMSDIVLSVATAHMRIAMNRAEDVDGMIAVHHAYISNLEDQCFLLEKHSSIRRAIISLLDLTVLFSDMQASRATRKMPSSSKARFTDTKVSHLEPNESANAGSDNEDSTSDSDESAFVLTSHAEPPDEDKLKNLLDTSENLLFLITASVKGLSKADNAPSWEILAKNLALGLEK